MEVKSSISFLKDCYRLMQERHIVMVYQGEFSQDITRSVLSMTETSFSAEGVNETVRKKVYNIMMESLQNICKHEFKAGIPDSNYESLFMIAATAQAYHIVTGNIVKRDILPTIKARIDQVNALDQEGLKALYKEARINATISAVGGAGLGFIDIARKSGEPIGYHFQYINPDLCYFTQMVTIKK